MLFEKHRGMPSMYEIPYGFKNLWRISVSAYSLTTYTFNESDLESATLNGYPVTADQMRNLYDFERDLCSLSQEGMSGLLVSVSSYDAGVYSFEVMVEQNLEIQGVLGVLGDMVDNSDPQRPVVGHDVQKLDVSQYGEDQTDLDERLTADEANIQANSDAISTLQQDSITAITVNGDAVPVTSGTAAISIDAVSSDDLSDALAAKVDKSVAGVGNRIVQNLADSFAPGTRTLTLAKTLLSLQDGSMQAATSNYPLADLLGVTALEAIDKELFYLCPSSAIASFSGSATISLSSLYRYNADGTTFNPSSTSDIRLIHAISTDYSGYGVAGRTYISAIGKVQSATSSSLTCMFTNLEQFAVYNKYNGYRSGVVVYDPALRSTFQVLQSVPRPSSDADTIPLTNALYYTPIQDYTIMDAGTVWANFEPDGSAGEAYPVSRARLELLKLGSGYDDYVEFLQATIPSQILTDADWNANISLWVTDGYQFTSLSGLMEYLSNFDAADRFKLSNRGVISTHYEPGGITITPEFTSAEIQAAFASVFQPIPTGNLLSQIPVFDSANKIVSSGKQISDFATAAQGAKADSAVQSVALASGPDNGTVKFTVNGSDTTAAVTGLGTAAYQNASAFATAAQGAKADNALQSASLAGGPTNGTVVLSTNGVAQTPVQVTGINTAAYRAEGYFATSAQGAKADSAVQSIDISPGADNGTIQYSVNGNPASTTSVAGLGSAAYTSSMDYATDAQGSKADSALQPSDVVDNVASTNTQAPLSANQGRLLYQELQSFRPSGRPVGGFQTYADRFTSSSQFPADLQPINVGDTIYISADENNGNQPAQYVVSAVAGDGTLTYTFVKLLPDVLRDFSIDPILSHELADGAVNTNHIQSGAVVEAGIAAGAVSTTKLSSDLQATVGKANNSIQRGIVVSGTGSIVSGISENVDNTLTVSYTNDVLSMSVSGSGEFLTGAEINGANLTLEKNGIALRSIVDNGSGNVIVGATVAGSDLILSRGNAITSLVSTGSGNVLTDISPTGTVTKGNALASIAKTGTGNVLTDISVLANAVSVATGTVFSRVQMLGEGTVVTSVAAQGDTLLITMGSAVTAIPQASTTTPGVVQLNDTLVSTRVDQALTANQGRALAESIASHDTQFMKLTGNQTVDGIKTLLNDLLVPSKSVIPSTPSATKYATEAQTATRIVRPTSAGLNNVAVFDANRDVIDSGVSYTSLETIPISENEIDAIVGAAFG